jgi:hypothetical protein
MNIRMADIETKMFAGSVADRVPVLWVSNNSQRRCFISVLSIGVDSRILTSCKLLQKRPAGLKIPPISLQRRRRLLALDLDQTIHYSRSPRRSRTDALCAHGCLRHTTPYHAPLPFQCLVQGRPATTITSEHPCDQPFPLDQAPKRVRFSLFHPALRDQ